MHRVCLHFDVDDVDEEQIEDLQVDVRIIR
jgi:hypothetical protein